MDLNKKLEELKPYQLNCNVFDVYSYNGLTMQDLLCQFFTKINECITVSNETIDLAKWLVNEGLEIEVVKKLMIWLEDGTLENIINVNLFNSLNDKINGLSSQLEQKVNKHNITLNIKDLGAKGDGLTDDTDIFKKAINQIGGEYSTGGTIFIPSGRYIITDTIFIPANVSLVGDGKTSYFSNIDNEIGTSIIFKCLDNDKPCISFIGKNSLNNNIYDYTVTGKDLDNGVYKQSTSSSLKNLTLYSQYNHNIGVVFSGAPLSKIEDITIKGFLGGIIVSGNWGSVINRVCTQTLFFGVLTSSNTNNLQISNSYFDKIGNLTSLPSENKLYNLVSSGDFLKPNISTGVFACYAYNLKVINTCIEHWDVGIQTGGAGASTNWDTVWLEFNKQPIATQSQSHNYKNIYVYGVEDGNAVVLASGTSLILENFSGTYKKLFKDTYQRYCEAIIINCLDNNNKINFLNSADKLDKVYIDEQNGSNYYFGNKTMPVQSLWKAFELVVDGGEIILLSDVNVSDASRISNKRVTIKTDGNTRTLSPQKANSLIRAIEVFNSSITFSGVNIDCFISTCSTSDTSYSGFIKPIGMFKNEVSFYNCTINTKSNYGILQHEYNSNSYLRLTLQGGEITGDGAMSRNAYNPSGTLHIEEFKQGCSIDSNVTTYGSSSVIIHQY